ncbi:MAG: Fe(3+) ABC transporter substrate-binding protein [Woeseiaceae bacterium]|nr:Fe(3+) ABC transporter substrate-binding protein [Woeseiaceae bacterium]
MSMRIAGGMLVVIFLSACGADTATDEAVEQENVVNIYTSRHYDTDLAMYEGFTTETGIQVNRIEAGADELIARIEAEGEFSPADLLVTVDAGRLWRAEEAGIFGSVDSDVLNSRIPDNLRHPDGLWYGLSTRARVIVYNKEAGKPDGLQNYEDLADPAHAGRVCIRSSGNIYNISLMASLIAHNGAEAAEEWGRGVVSNFAREPQSNDTGQVRAVASGECGIAIANSYYVARLFASDNAEDNAVANDIGVIFPNQATTGAHVNVSGAGVIKTAPNRENAVRFLEYLTSDTAQRYFANGNHEYPVVAGLTGSEAMQLLGEFKPDSLNVGQLGIHQAEAVMVFDRVGWK